MQRDVRAEREHIDRTVAGKTVCSLFQETVGQFGDVDALKWKRGDTWHSLTWREYAEHAQAFAQGLMLLGLQAGEFVNILAANRAEYYIADLAILHAGAVPVSLYNSLPSEQIEYIANHCEATYAIVENAAFYERLRGVRQSLPRVRRVIMMDGAEAFADDPWVIGFDKVFAAGREAAPEVRADFDRRWRAVPPTGLATLIYTSGTTGPPKGVMVTHYNVVWTAESLHSLFPREAGMRHISYLPLAHIAERMAGHYLQIRAASTCHFCPSPQEIAQYLTEVRPQFFFAVPRIWEKLHSGLTTAIANNPDETQRAFAQGAIDIGLEKVRLQQAGQPIPPELAEKLPQAEMVSGLIRQRVGLDEVQIASSGAAPVAAELLEWFHAIGVPVCEVYGQSEDCGPTSWNRPGAAKIGTVGPSVPGVEVQLAEDGELWVRGGNVTAGYYKEPALTAETFDSEGWLHSGDVAVIDPQGFIKIVDRKKEILITAGGKNIAPSNIENLLKQKPLVGQACVVADRRPFVGALVVLDAETVLPWAQQRGLPTDLAALADHPEVHAEIKRYMDEVNTHLNNVEAIKKFVVLPQEWTPETGELTPTLKMKRRIVNERYAAAIERMYGR